MNFDLANLCDVHPDGTMHYNIDRIYIFDINLIQLDSFIMGTNKNSKNIHVSYDLREKKRKKKERKMRNEGSIFLKTCKGQKN